MQPGRYYRISQWFGILYLTINAENAAQFSLRVAVHHFFGGKWWLPAHPHIKLRVKTDGKAPLGLVKLVRRYAQIGKNTINRDSMVEAAEIFKVSEVLVYKNKTLVIDHILLRIRVLVKGQQLAIFIEPV